MTEHDPFKVWAIAALDKDIPVHFSREIDGPPQTNEGFGAAATFPEGPEGHRFPVKSRRTGISSPESGSLATAPSANLPVFYCSCGFPEPHEDLFKKRRQFMDAWAKFCAAAAPVTIA